MKTTTSTALLAAWFVLIACLIAVITFFWLKGCSPAAPTLPDVPVVAAPQPNVPKPPPPKRPTRGDSRGPTPPARKFQIEGVVRSRAGEFVAGARVAIFAPSTAEHARPVTPPNMEEIRWLNQLVMIDVAEWDVARPLTDWTGGEDATHPTDAELAGTDTGAEGKFVLALPQRIGAGPFRLTAKKEGVGMIVVNEVRADGEPLQLMLAPAASVAGTVITEVDSVPVAAARVVFDNGLRRFSAATDSAGKFVAEGVTPGPYEVSVSAKGRTPLFEKHFKVEADNLNPMVLHMPRGTTLKIQALLQKPDAPVRRPGTAPAEGEPIAGAKIVAYSQDMLAYVIGLTNAQGYVEFAGMPAGEYTINGMAKGVTSQTEVNVTLDKNQLVQEESIDFDPAVETTIEVVDESGRPVAGVEFYGLNNEDKYDSLRSAPIGVTDGDGKLKFAFEIMGPRSGAYGFKSGFAAVHAVPDPTADEPPPPLRVVAKKPVRVHGVVKTSDGRPVPDAIVSVNAAATGEATSPEGDMDFEIRADAQGRYDFPYLPRVEGMTVSASLPDTTSPSDEDVELVEGKSDYVIDLSLEMDDAVPPVAPKIPKPGETPQGLPPK